MKSKIISEGTEKEKRKKKLDIGVSNVDKNRSQIEPDSLEYINT